MRQPANAYCARCAHEVEVVNPWGGFAWVKRSFYVGLLAIVALTPILLSEITVLMPLAMTFALAAGPVHYLAAQRRTCRECGAELAKH